MQKIGSFLKWLWSIISGGIHVGDKTDNRTTNDSSQKNTVVGNNNCITETKIESQYNAPSTINITVSDSRNVSIGDFSTKTFTLSSNTNSSSNDLSEQAKSFIRQMIKNQSNSIIVFELVGIVDSIILFEAKREMIIEDKLSAPDDLDALKLNNFLRYCGLNKNQTGKIYALTTQGREYGKKLLEENRGNTSI